MSEGRAAEMRVRRWAGARARNKTRRGPRCWGDLYGFADGAAVTWFTF